MNHRFMGRTGLRVSELCLGAMTFGRESSEEVSHQILDAFVEAGGDFIDTANVYSLGLSEEILGRWLKGKRRDDLVIATKVRFPMGDQPNNVGVSRKHIFSSVEASLRRLGTDYIDLYQVHCWDSKTPLEETLSTLDTLVRAGKVRYIGVSQQGWEPYTCLQPLYNLLDRSTEWELIPVCLNEGLGIIPWSPLRGGWLSGKYRRDMKSPPDGTRIKTAEEKGWSENWTKYATERTWRVLDELFRIADELGKSPAQIALNWILQQPGVTAPIIGARTMEQLADNLGAAGWTLPAEHRACLDEVSAVEEPYPYAFITGAQQRR
jgi:aryl-alcohol dehydrogenase-like predicted oxidoreductase